jgi:hypothetical protein
MRSRGSYLGTLALAKPWYARTINNPAYPDKGPGEYWYDYKGFYFVRQGSGRGIVIPSESILSVSIGYRHGFSFSRLRILKIVWQKGREKLSSGFAVTHPEQIKQALTTTGWA